MKSSLIDFAKDAGDVLLPAMTDIVTKTNEWIRANNLIINSNLKKWISEVVEKTKLLVEYIVKHGDLIGTLFVVGTISLVIVKLWGIAAALGAISASPAFWILSGTAALTFAGYKAVTTAKPLGERQPFMSTGTRMLGETPDTTQYGYNAKWEYDKLYNLGRNMMVIDRKKLPKPKAVTPQTGVAWTGGLSLGGESSYPSLSGAPFDPYAATAVKQDAMKTLSIAESMRHAENAMREFDKTVKENQKTTNQMSTGWISLGNTMSNVLANSVMESGNAFKNIGNAFSRMLQIMVAELLTKTAVFGFLNMVSGGGFGLAAGGLKGFLGFRQAGGPVLAGVPYMVGERGREVFVPESNGTVVPNQNISNDRSTNTFNMNLRNEDLNLMTVSKFAELYRTAKRDGYLG